MKQQKFLGIILVFCVLVPFAGCASAPTFDGSIHIDVERVPKAVEPEETQEPESVTLTKAS